MESTTADPAAAKPAHTPGPWKVGFSDGSGETYITAAGNKVVVSGIESITGTPSGVRSPADAHLIAAAPEMLALLQKLIDRETGVWYISAFEMDHDIDGEEMEAEINALIAKATGSAA